MTRYVSTCEVSVVLVQLEGQALEVLLWGKGLEAVSGDTLGVVCQQPEQAGEVVDLVTTEAVQLVDPIHDVRRRHLQGGLQQVVDKVVPNQALSTYRL